MLFLNVLAIKQRTACVKENFNTEPLIGERYEDTEHKGSRADSCQANYGRNFLELGITAGFETYENVPCVITANLEFTDNPNHRSAPWSAIPCNLNGSFGKEIDHGR